jgi:hypothetical protein
MTDLEAAWDELHDAKPEHSFVGRPTYHDARREWVMYDVDTREKAKAGHRTHECEAVAQSELDVVREMTRCLRLIVAGEWPT